MLKLLRHLLCTLQTPSRYLAHTNQTASRHLSDILPTPFRHPPNSSLLYCMKVWFPTRLGGWSPVQNHANLWSNLQDCKISSRAEIPKLDRVWQKPDQIWTQSEPFPYWFHKSGSICPKMFRSKQKSRNTDQSGGTLIVQWQEFTKEGQTIQYVSKLGIFPTNHYRILRVHLYLRIIGGILLILQTISLTWYDWTWLLMKE